MGHVAQEVCGQVGAVLLSVLRTVDLVECRHKHETVLPKLADVHALETQRKAFDVMMYHIVCAEPVERDAAASSCTPLSNIPLTSCSTNWTLFQNHCYRALTARQAGGAAVNRTQYQQACKALNATVVSIHSKAENTFVADLANKANSSSIANYIGLGITHSSAAAFAPVNKMSWFDILQWTMQTLTPTRTDSATEAFEKIPLGLNWLPFLRLNYPPPGEGSSYTSSIHVPWQIISDLIYSYFRRAFCSSEFFGLVGYKCCRLWKHLLHLGVLEETIHGHRKEWPAQPDNKPANSPDVIQC
uniref:C-type lectin domain-containing protein n=1 Tax=Ditylenchus dipsaci TaxID=166011 RepID=A0A915E6W2_9BILA